MGNEHLVYIPKGAKIFIASMAVLIFFVSIGLVAYMLTNGAGDGIISTALVLAQTCAAGLSIVALIFFTKFSANIDDLRDKTTTFFVSEIPYALGMVEYDEGDFIELNQAYKPLETETKIRLFIRHRKGSHDCQYRLRAYGRDQRIYIQTNVKRMVVSYFLDSTSVEDKEIRERLDFVVTAAETAGYSHVYKKIHDTADKTVTIQLRLFRSLPDEFLMTPGERLFIANDFASMTKALMRALPEPSSVSPLSKAGV